MGTMTTCSYILIFFGNLKQNCGIMLVSNRVSFGSNCVRTLCYCLGPALLYIVNVDDAVLINGIFWVSFVSL